MKKKTKRCKIKRNINDEFEFFRLFLWHVHGITYTKNTFDRRLKLMNETEFNNYSNYLHKMIESMDYPYLEKSENIDAIMSSRAEIEQDECDIYGK